MKARPPIIGETESSHAEESSSARSISVAAAASSADPHNVTVTKIVRKCQQVFELLKQNSQKRSAADTERAFKKYYSAVSNMLMGSKKENLPHQMIPCLSRGRVSLRRLLRSVDATLHGEKNFESRVITVAARLFPSASEREQACILTNLQKVLKTNFVSRLTETQQKQLKYVMEASSLDISSQSEDVIRTALEVAISRSIIS